MLVLCVRMCANEIYWLRAYVARDLPKPAVWDFDNVSFCSFVDSFFSDCCCCCRCFFFLRLKIMRKYPNIFYGFYCSILWQTPDTIMLSNQHAKQIRFNSRGYQYHLLRAIPNIHGILHTLYFRTRKSVSCGKESNIQAIIRYFLEHIAHVSHMYVGACKQQLNNVKCIRC